MAIRWAVQNGNWSDTATWDGGTLPDVGDDVYSNGFTVTIDQDINVNKITHSAASGIVAGGGFALSTIRNLVCNVEHNNLNTVGNLLIYNINSGGTIIGNIIGPSGGLTNGGQAVRYLSSNTLSITGNISGGTFPSAVSLLNIGAALMVNAPAIINITGNIEGSGVGGTQSNDTASCLVTSSGAVVNITGNVLGCNLSISATLRVEGTLNLIGNAIGRLGPAVTAQSIGTNSYVSNAVASSTSTAPAVSNISPNGFIVLNSSEYSSIGTAPTRGYIKYKTAFANTITIVKENNSSVILQDFADIENELPAESDVREGVLYNADQKIGTLAVPSPADVRRSVPTDNTVGTADLTGEDILQAIQDSTTPLAERLRNVSTVQLSGAQLQAFLTQ